MRISDWSSDVCSSDLHLGTVAKEGEVRRRAVADAHLSGEGGVVVLACPKYRGPAVRCRRRRQLQKIGCILALHVVQTKQLYHSTHRSEEHTSELQSLMRISYAVFCLKKKKTKKQDKRTQYIIKKHTQNNLTYK